MSWDWLEKIADGFKVEDEIRQTRVNICNSCEHLTTMKTCGKCNCFMPAKTWIKFASCPIEKWTATDVYRKLPEEPKDE